MNNILNVLQFNKIKGEILAGNTGRLFKNPEYHEGSNRPRYKGQCEIDGVMKAMSAWVKTSKNGTPYFYITFEKLSAQPKQKIIPTKSKNTDGIRKVEKIAAGKKEEKVKTADIDVSGIPF